MGLSERRNTMTQEKQGVLGTEYADGRKSNKALKYRLWRRTHEVREAIRKFLDVEPRSIIDLGTAEARMLNELQQSFPSCRCVGVEYNPELVELAHRMFPGLDVRQGDVQELGVFGEEEFDVAVATAVIEHLEQPEIFIDQVVRILRPGGLLVMTAPDPFWEHVATFVGHLSEEQHHNVPNLRRLCSLVENGGMRVCLAQKFMLSPVGMPAEFAVEKLVRALGMNFMMANQLVVSERGMGLEGEPT